MQRLVSSVLDSAVLDERDGPLRVLSVCSGDGRDIIGVLADRPDAARVHATLLEVHPSIADGARRRAAEAGLADQVEVRTVDAGSSDAYLDLSPADLVLLVGIFGNISDEDLHRTITASAGLCAPGAHLLWSRGRGGGAGRPERGGPGLVPRGRLRRGRLRDLRTRPRSGARARPLRRPVP